MRIDVVTLFPAFVAECAAFGITGRAVERGLLELAAWNPRDYAEGNYRKVDDRTFGGGPGMVMLIEPLLATFRAMHAAANEPAHVVYLTPQGAPLTQARVRELSQSPRLALLCGRYEGVDERFVETQVHEEISLGDYVLSGGELGAAVIIDAVARLQPGAMSDAESAEQDSFEDGLLDCPHFSKPVSHTLGEVPPVLLSGNHAEIARWRREQSLVRTAQRRPELLKTAPLTVRDRKFLSESGLWDE